jgi:hypothetical protein
MASPPGSGDLDVGKGQVLVGLWHELFTLDDVQQVEDVLVQDVPWTDLLFDHVETGLFSQPVMSYADTLLWLDQREKEKPSSRRRHQGARAAKK